MHRDTFIAKLSEIQQSVGELLAQLQASEHDKFAAHLYRSRREYRSACQRAGKSGKQIERCVIATFRIAESMGFKGEFRQWAQPPPDQRLIDLHTSDQSQRWMKRHHTERPNGELCLI